jgi:GNAT superfamily N-acetyltransferase
MAPPSEDRGHAITYAIRTARPADLERLRDIYREASLANVGDRVQLLSRPDLLVLSDDAVRQQRCRIAVGPDDQLLGFSSHLVAGDAVELEDLFVAPSAWRRGVGRALVRDVVSIAQSLDRTRITVTTNPNALAFYESVGFVFDCDVATELGPAARFSIDLS